MKKRGKSLIARGAGKRSGLDSGHSLFLRCNDYGGEDQWRKYSGQFVADADNTYSLRSALYRPYNSNERIGDGLKNRKSRSHSEKGHEKHVVDPSQGGRDE